MLSDRDGRLRVPVSNRAVAVVGLLTVGLVAGPPAAQPVARAAEPPGTVTVATGATTTRQLLLAPGRVVWVDDRAAGTPTWQRLGATTTTLGPEQRVAVPGGAPVTAVSGARLFAPGHYFDGLDWATLNLPGSPTLASGQLVSNGSQTLDLATGRSLSGAATSLWGGAAYGWSAAGITATRPDGTATLVLARAGAGLAADETFTTVQAQGDVLAWGASSGTVRWRGRDGVVRGPVTGTLRQVSAGRLLVTGADGSAQVLLAATGAVLLDLVPGPTPAEQPVSVGLGPHGLSWVARSGEPRISPLPDPGLPPRHVGAPAAPATWDRLDGSWLGQWTFTEPLTTCRAQLSAPTGQVVQDVPCEPSFMALGAALVLFDPRDLGGRLLPAGRYTWRLVGGGRHGSLVDTDGAAPLTGTIDVPTGLVPVPPARLLDTRPGQPTVDGRASGAGALGPDQVRTVPVTGRAGVPATGVAAVAVNVTGIQPSAGTYLTTYAAGRPRPHVSTINLAAGEVYANATVVPVGADGSIALYNAQGRADAAIDVVGWFPAGTAPSFVPVEPARLLDTRPGGATVDGHNSGAGPFGPQSDPAWVSLWTAGRAGIPAGSRDPVLANLTGILPDKPTYLSINGRVDPAANPTSSVNLQRSTIVPGLVVGGDGGLEVDSSDGLTDATVDVLGYFVSGRRFGRPAAPWRALDTRESGGPVRGGTTRVVQVTGSGVPLSASVVVINVTGVLPTVGTFVTAYPSGRPRPGTSTLNLAAGDIRANLAFVQPGPDGTITLYSAVGETDLLVDVVGYLE